MEPKRNTYVPYMYIACFNFKDSESFQICHNVMCRYPFKTDYSYKLFEITNHVKLLRISP